MSTRLFLILCLVGIDFAEKPPDVKCKVINLEYVKCLWNASGVNYSFYSGFHGKPLRECDSYIVESGLNVGCKQPEDKLETVRFNTCYTELRQGNQAYRQNHQLKDKVKLNPPSNCTVQLRSDANLWFKWRQIFTKCVESEVRYRVNNHNWELSKISLGVQEYCINFPSNSSRYELQVRSALSHSCGSSEEWSEWSEPVVWGAHNKTGFPPAPPPDKLRYSVDVWSVVLFCVGGATLILLIVLLLHHERIRIILIPVVPKPSLVPRDLEEWLDSSKGLKEAFKTSYTERTCSVREYCSVPPSDTDSSDSSILSVSTNQTVCYNPVPSPDPNDSGPSSSDEFVPPEEQHVPV
ncbi:cytokine receptor common subunit gamma-like [Eucyclogobius newberryi]|uniref:cytokine receptor common subunit gamma-like n=1 Tax=Eucyclogobius newberryi TaxID=166745 RepID=UPI003B5B4193